jgi:hypothetical protein
MDLATVVRRYLELAGGYGRSVELARLGLPPADVERLFSAWDEDYQISRYILLSHPRAAGPAAGGFLIGGQRYTHVLFRPGIEQFLAPG